MPTAPPVAAVALTLPSRAPELLSDWYVHHLGFEARDGRLHSGPLVLEWVEGTPSAAHRPRLRLTLESLGALLEVHRRLEDGGAVVSPLAGDERRALVRLVDPEGNTLELDHR